MQKHSLCVSWIELVPRKCWVRSQLSLHAVWIPGCFYTSVHKILMMSLLPVESWCWLCFKKRNRGLKMPNIRAKGWSRLQNDAVTQTKTQNRKQTVRTKSPAGGFKRLQLWTAEFILFFLIAGILFSFFIFIFISFIFIFIGFFPYSSYILWFL